MPASSFHPLWPGALLAFAGLVGGMSPADAADVFFPATVHFPASIAYHRHHYDPFDQATQAAAEDQILDRSNDHRSSEVRLVGSDPFDRLTPTPVSQKQANPVEPAALQAAAPAPLPTPPSAKAPAAAPAAPGADWSPKPLADLTTNTLPASGVLPRDYWSERTPQHVTFFDPCGTTRGWPVNTFNWVASCLCHNPLYFEEINLERYGYGCCECVQPAVSAAHFFATVPALPYMMAVDCPGECDYTLGHYRPGSCPPRRYHCCTSYSALGALSAGGVATGLIFLIP